MHITDRARKLLKARVATLLNVSDILLQFLWRGFKFKRGHGPCPYISAAYAVQVFLYTERDTFILGRGSF